MTIAESSEIGAVVQKVQSWPVPMRRALARRILELSEETAGPETPSERQGGYSAKEVEALLKIDQASPDDATVKQWIEEHHMKKYGA